jgi:hypothetical protein
MPGAASDLFYACFCGSLSQKKAAVNGQVVATAGSIPVHAAPAGPTEVVSLGHRAFTDGAYTGAPIPDNESERWGYLCSLNVLDTAPEVSSSDGGVHLPYMLLTDSCVNYRDWRQPLMAQFWHVLRDHANCMVLHAHGACCGHEPARPNISTLNGHQHSIMYSHASLQQPGWSCGDVDLERLTRRGVCPHAGTL